MHMTAINLTAPAIADLNFAVTRRSAVPDHEMIGETVFHSADLPMIIVEHARVALTGSAVVDDDDFPAVTGHRRPPYLFDHRSRKVAVSPF